MLFQRHMGALVQDELVLLLAPGNEQVTTGCCWGAGSNIIGCEQTGCAQSTFTDTLSCGSDFHGFSKCNDTGGAHRWLAAYPCSVGFG